MYFNILMHYVILSTLKQEQRIFATENVDILKPYEHISILTTILYIARSLKTLKLVDTNRIGGGRVPMLFIGPLEWVT